MKRVLSSLAGFAFLSFVGCSTTDAMVPSYYSTSAAGRNAVMTALASTTGGAQQKEEIDNQNRKVVVVGGGPVGLATALTLSNPPHCFDVTLLEQSVGDASVARYDPTKAYLYLVNPRGQVWMKKFPSSFEKLLERGAENPSMGSLMVVPADPTKPLPQPSKTQTKQGSVEGKLFKATNAAAAEGDKSYWIPRHSMVVLLMEVIAEQEKARKKEKNSELGSIDLVDGKLFQSIQCLRGQDHSRRPLEVTVQDMKSNKARYKHSYEADLVVGADGMNSAVRECLAEQNTVVPILAPTALQPAIASWLTRTPYKFKVRRWVSPSTGLRMKVLQFPPKFPIPDSDGSVVLAEGLRSFAIRSVNTGPTNRISLGVLPVKDPNMIRSINVITRPSHDVWHFQSGREAKAWFQKAFPRLDFDQLTNAQEWNRFVAAKGTSFPYCQYSPGLQVSSPDETEGVVLVGDAVHAFPPDIGQGINAGLADVVALDRALCGHDVITGQAPSQSTLMPTLGAALKQYERMRLPEIKALIRIARFGAPYQYNQSLRKDRIGRFLWKLNVLPRVLLHKISFGLVPPPVVMMVMKKDLTFRQAMRRADMTTALLVTILLSMVWKIVGTSLKKILVGICQ